MRDTFAGLEEVRYHVMRVCMKALWQGTLGGSRNLEWPLVARKWGLQSCKHKKVKSTNNHVS